jgi:hypothetical protein
VIQGLKSKVYINKLKSKLQKLDNLKAQLRNVTKISSDLNREMSDLKSVVKDLVQEKLYRNLTNNKVNNPKEKEKQDESLHYLMLVDFLI